MDEKSRYTISEETIAETKRCKKGFSCLTGQREDLCPIESCINGKVHFIKCFSTTSCSYRVVYSGDEGFCYCPTRKELYNKHGV
jgi:hypothetical protein